jgi:hypothetical protein
MRRRIIPIILIVVMLFVFASLYYRWKKSSEDQCFIEKQETINEIKIKEPEQNPINDNYIPSPKQEIVRIEKQPDHLYEWVKNYSEQLMTKFKIDHAHRDIFKAIHDFILVNGTRKAEECDLLFAVFSECPAISVSKKMDMSVYLIWKSRKQEQIDRVYDTILSIAADKQENPKVRANALEILMRSNNKIYMDRSRRIMESLQEHEKVQEMAQILKRMETIQSAMQKRAAAPQQNAPLTPYQQVHQLNNTPPPLTPEEAQIQQALLDQYRRLERRAFNAMKNKATVYDDTQNVHNHKINETVINSVQNIMNHTGAPTSAVFIEKELAMYYPDYTKKKEKILASINRIRSDPSKFKGDTTISQVFDRIVSIISNSTHKEEMWKRMGEELVDMNQLCATGHMSRIVNVIQGFEDVPQEFQIRMDPKDEIYANLSNYITMQVQESGEADKILESMIDPDDRTLFIGFVSIVLKPKVEELHKEYQGVVEADRLTECINTSIRNYIKNEKETENVLKAIYN